MTAAAHDPVVSVMALRPLAEDVRAARAFAVAQVTPYVVNDEAGDDFLFAAATITGEFTTNALDAGARLIRLIIETRPEGVLISVIDDARGQLRVPVHDPLAARGRGLRMVDRLARRWGVSEDPDGKRIWAELDFPR